MNRNASMLTLSLILAAGTTLAATPQVTPSKPAASQSMQMNGMKMDGQMPMDHSADKAAFVKLDKNGDGEITKSEIPSDNPLARHFDMLDANKDGGLSAVEFAAHDGM